MEQPLQLATGAEPLGLRVEAAAASAAHPDLAALAFEFASRGGRVKGRLLLPPQHAGRVPTLLLQHDTGSSARAAELDGVAGRFAQRGIAVASIDFPLHGTRADVKIPDRLRDHLLSARSADSATPFGIECARQAVIDLQRTCDALLALEPVDCGRIGFAGVGLGAMLGAVFCALDSRPCAAVLLSAGARANAGILDPARYIGAFAPRPLLFVNATRDEIAPRESAEALYAAAGDSKQQLWSDAPRTELARDAMPTIQEFLTRHLLDPTSR